MPSTTYSPLSDPPIRTPMFDGDAFNQNANGVSQGGSLTRTWILWFQSLKKNVQSQVIGPIIGFVINTGATGTNVGPMLPAPYDGTANIVTVVVKASDPDTPLSFRINQNGTDIFVTDPSIPAGTTSGMIFGYADETEQPLAVNYNDIFTIDILTGSSSWEFTAVLETSAPVIT
jgi:hypothetical protein